MSFRKSMTVRGVGEEGIGGGEEWRKGRERILNQKFFSPAEK